MPTHSPAAASSVSTFRIWSIVCCLTLSGAGIGGVIGGFLGSMTPGYYRSVFRGGHDAAFDPFETGLALGVGQGSGGGLMAGIVVAAILVWRSTGHRIADREETTTQITNRRWRIHIAWLIPILCLLGLMVGSLAFLAGGIVGQSEIYERRAHEEIRLVRNELDGNERFGLVEITRTSDGYVHLSGNVTDETSHDELRKVLHDLFGIRRANELVRQVTVRPAFD